MTTFSASAELALHELDACRGLLLRATDPDWDRPTPCEGWQVEDLARHLAAVAWQQAEAFHRGGAGIGEAPSWLEAKGNRSAILDLLAAAREHLGAGIDRVAADPGATVPLPFAPLPAPIAADGLVLEYGVHRYDLEVSLGRATDIDLDGAVAARVAGLLPALVPILAEKPPAAPITYRLVGDTTSVTITWRDDAWHGGDDAVDGTPVCEVRGDDASVVLLALGRIDAGHPALAVSGDTAAAASLSDHIRNL